MGLTSIDQRLWDCIETQIAHNDAQTRLLEHTIRQMEDGARHGHCRDGNAIHECLEHTRQAIETLVEANRIMQQTCMDLLKPYGAVSAAEPTG